MAMSCVGALSCAPAYITCTGSLLRPTTKAQLLQSWARLPGRSDRTYWITARTMLLGFCRWSWWALLRTTHSRDGCDTAAEKKQLHQASLSEIIDSNIHTGGLMTIAYGNRCKVTLLLALTMMCRPIIAYTSRLLYTCGRRQSAAAQMETAQGRWIESTISHD